MEGNVAGRQNSRMPVVRYCPLLGCLALAACQIMSGGIDPPIPVARQSSLLIDVASAVERHSAAIDSIWPGFWPAAHSYALYPHGTGTLVVSTEEIEGATQVPERDVPEILRGRAYYAPGRPFPELPSSFTFDYQVASRRMVAVSAVGPHGPMRDSVRATIFFLIHESFHDFQERTWSDFRSPPSKGVGPMTPLSITAPTVQKGLAAERHALQATVGAHSPGQMRALYGQYLSLRTDRLRTMARSIGVGESFAERIEGVPTYVGFLGAFRSAGDAPDRLAAGLVEYLDEPGWEIAAQDSELRYGQWHIYAAGAAKAFILERTGIEWRSKVAAGHSMDELLEAWAAENQ